MRVLVLLLALLGGCFGEQTDALTDPGDPDPPNGVPGTLAGRAGLVPSAPPETWNETGASIFAAETETTSGGLAGSSSGPSATLLLSDGSVIGVYGHPWGPEGNDTCDPRHLELFQPLGENFTISCDRVDAVASGRIPADVWPAIKANLTGLGLPPIPSSQQEYGCCDRVFTTGHMWFGHEDWAVWESFGEPAPDLAIALQDLRDWLRSEAS